MIAKLFIYN